MKIFLALLAAVVVLGGLGAVMDSVFDFRTDRLTEEFQVSTAVGKTAANVTLANALWDSSVAYASASSNQSADAPTTNTYNATSRQLEIGGLSANTTRTLTVVYNTEGLADYTGASEGIIHLPTALVLGLILVPVLTIIMVLYRKYS